MRPFDAAAFLADITAAAASACSAARLRQRLASLREDIEDGAVVLSLEASIQLLAGMSTDALFAHADGRVGGAAVLTMAVVALRIVALTVSAGAQDGGIEHPWALGCVEKYITIVGEMGRHRLQRVRSAAVDAAVLLGRHPHTPRVLVLKLLEVVLARLQDPDAGVRLSALTFLLCVAGRLGGDSTALFDNLMARLPQLLNDPSTAVRAKVGQLLALGHLAAPQTLLSGFRAEEWAVAAPKKAKSLLMLAVDQKMGVSADPDRPDSPSPDDDTGDAARTAIESLGLITVSLEDNAHSVRQTVLRSVARLGLQRARHPAFIQTALPFVVDSCFDEDNRVRLEAIRCIAEWSSWVSLNVKQITILLDCLTDPEGRGPGRADPEATGDAQKVLRVTLFTLGCLRLPDPSTLLLCVESLLSVLTSVRFGPQFSMIHQALMRLGRRHAEWVPDIVHDLLPGAGEGVPPAALKGLSYFLLQSPLAMANLPMNHPRLGKYSVALPYQSTGSGHGPPSARDTTFCKEPIPGLLPDQRPLPCTGGALQAFVGRLMDVVLAVEERPALATCRALIRVVVGVANVLHPMPRAVGAWLQALHAAVEELRRSLASTPPSAVKLPRPPPSSSLAAEPSACSFEQRIWLIAEAVPEWRTWRTVGFLVRAPAVHARVRSTPHAISLDTPGADSTCVVVSNLQTSSWGWELSWRLDVHTGGAIRPDASVTVVAVMQDVSGFSPCARVRLSRPIEIIVPP